MYDSASEIDPKGIFATLNKLCLLGDDIYLRSQALNLGIIDKFITDLEYKVLNELNATERTPPLTFFLSAQSQMWIFSTYELLRTWQQRAKGIVRAADNGGLQLKLRALKEKNDDYLHFGREIRIRQIETILEEPSLITQIKNQLSHLHIPFARLEYIRITIAKHEIRGRENSAALTPGYGRINIWCGSIDYDFTNGRDSMGFISRRDIADTIRSLDFNQEPPRKAELDDFDKIMEEFQKGFQTN
jgi:hypothetical protein